MEHAIVELKTDPVEEQIDELADICEYWKKNREKGKTPYAIKAAIKMIADSIAHPLIYVEPAAKEENKQIVLERISISPKNGNLCAGCYFRNGLRCALGMNTHNDLGVCLYVI
jgi:hypothetical protein